MHMVKLEGCLRIFSILGLCHGVSTLTAKAPFVDPTDDDKPSKIAKVASDRHLQHILQIVFDVKLVWLLVALAWTVDCHGQSVNDRSDLFLPGTQLSDDLRQIPVRPGTGVPDTSIFIDNARLFDGYGPVLEDVAILIVGNRITALGPDLIRPDDAILIDAAGRTVMPGLIDLHVHLTYVEDFTEPRELAEENQSDAALRGQARLRAYVENGITAIRDTSSDGFAPFRLKKWVNDGRIPGPRVFVSGQFITGIGGHATEDFAARTAPKFPESALREATGADDWVAAVREQFKKGADFIKLGSHYSPEEIEAAVAEAHRLGLRVTVDSETIYTELAVDAGADSIEHPLPRSDGTIRKMAKRGVVSVPTIVPYQLIIRFGGGYFGSTSRRFSLTEEVMFDQVRKMKAAGVTLGIGTDLILDWYRYLPVPYIQELQNFEQLGYTAAEVLAIATRVNAEIIGFDKHIGTIEVGKLADIIIVDGNPDENLPDVANVDTVIVGGRIVVEENLVVLPRPYVPTPLPTK